MAKALLIVESPTKAKTLSRYLGKEFEVRASVGHIKDLPKSKLGVAVEDNFRPDYVPVAGKERVIKEIREAAGKAEKIYLGPDPDREGEAIAWHLAEEIRSAARGKAVHRALFNEITRKAVLYAIEHPAKLDTKKYEAQQARRILDRLVGYLISPLLWSKVRWGLSAGRVQTVALRLISEREQDIHNFVSEEYWSIVARLRGKAPPTFDAKLVKYRGEEIKVPNQQGAEEVLGRLRGATFRVEKVTEKERNDNPPPPLITSTLQQEAYYRLGFSASKTMTLAQRLYEGVELKKEGQVGLITYMRTDSTRLAPEAIGEARRLIQEDHGREYLPSKANIYKNKRGAQDAHEGIRPTDVWRRPTLLKQELEKDLLALYEIIWRRFVACQMAPARLIGRGVDIAAGEHLFHASSTSVKFPGYLAVLPKRSEEDEASKLPSLAEGEPLVLEELIPKQHFTEPPPRYTEASLIKELERLGIGRPSTYAQILTNVQEKDYTKKVDGKFRATELGMLVSKLLVDNFPRIFDVRFTAAMEERLDEIEEGKREWLPIMQRFYARLTEEIERAEREMRDLKKEPFVTDLVCEKCSSALVIKWGKNGEFLACSAYPACDYTSEFVRDSTGMIQPVKRDAGEACDKCGRPMVIKFSRFGRFLACSGYPECRNTRPVRVGVRCPREGCDGEIVEKRSKKGRIFFGCSRFPKCDLAMWDRPVSETCPQCGSPYLVEKRSRARGDSIICPSQGCNYRRPLSA